MLSKVLRPAIATASAAGLFVASPSLAAFGDTSKIGVGLNATGTATNGNLLSVFAKIINIMLTIIGILAVIMLIVGGIMYVVSAGDSKRVESAKNTILYAIIGIVVAAVAGLIVKFVLGSSGIG